MRPKVEFPGTSTGDEEEASPDDDDKAYCLTFHKKKCPLPRCVRVKVDGKQFCAPAPKGKTSEELYCLDRHFKNCNGDDGRCVQETDEDGKKFCAPDAGYEGTNSEQEGRCSGAISKPFDSKGATWYVSPDGVDNDNDETSFKTLQGVVSFLKQEACKSGISTSPLRISGGGRILVLKGSYTWSVDEGTISGLAGASAEDPLLVEAEEGTMLQGANELDPSAWAATSNSGVYCADISESIASVRRVWMDGLLGTKAQVPNVNGNMDDPKAWPIPEDPTARIWPAPGSFWDRSVRLGGDGLIMSGSPVMLSPPPHCARTDGTNMRIPCEAGCKVWKRKNKCPKGLNDCPEAYVLEVNKADATCSTLFDTCQEPEDFPSCLYNHNVGSLKLPPSFDSSVTGKNYVGGEIHVTMCSEKQLRGPFPIVGHNGRTVYFDYSEVSVNHDKPARRPEFWEGMISMLEAPHKINQYLDEVDKTEFNVRGGEAVRDLHGFRVTKNAAFKIRAADELDDLREWWYDRSKGSLCAKFEGDPTKSPPVKFDGGRTKMLHLDSCENIRVSNFRLFATTLSSVGGSNVAIHNFHIEYPPEEILLKPAHLINSVIRFGSKDVRVSGGTSDSCVIENNLLEYSESGFHLEDCTGGRIVRNTVHRIFNGDAFRIQNPACTDSMWKERGQKGCGMAVEKNRIVNLGYNGHCDCSGIQTKWTQVRGFSIISNWLMRMPGHKGVRIDTSENGALITNNVVVACAKGMMIKGGTREGNMVFHNTAFGSKDLDVSVAEHEFGDGSTTPYKPYNTKSRVFSNAVNDWRDSESDFAPNRYAYIQVMRSLNNRAANLTSARSKRHRAISGTLRFGRSEIQPSIHQTQAVRLAIIRSIIEIA